MGTKIDSIIVMGIILGISLIWLLGDLNPGGVGLVILVSLAVASLFVAMVSALLKKIPKSDILLSTLCFLIGIGIGFFVGQADFMRAPSKMALVKPSFTPTRAYLLSGELPLPGLGAYGYAILTAKPSSDENDRILVFADTYLRHFELLPTHWADYPERYLVTHWLIKQPIDHYDESAEVLIKEYDFLQAKEMLSSIGKLNARGPILVAWNEPYLPGKKNKGLIIDLSRISKEDFDRLFRIWAERIAWDPRLWADGLKAVMFKEALRSLINRYGEEIVSSVEASVLK